MKYSEKLCEECFSDVVSKQAYLKCCRWLAENIISNTELDVTYQIQKLPNKNLPTFKLTVYATVNEEEVHNQHCTVCQEVHKLHYLNSAKRDCNSCNIDAYLRRLRDLMDKRKTYFKEKLDKEY
jgi:hypothetical protein